MCLAHQQTACKGCSDGCCRWRDEGVETVISTYNAHGSMHKHRGRRLHLSISSTVLPPHDSLLSQKNISKPLNSLKSFFIIFELCQGYKRASERSFPLRPFWNGFTPNGLFIPQLRWIISVTVPDEVAFLICKSCRGK